MDQSGTQPGTHGDLTEVGALGDQLLRLQRRRTHVYEGVRLENSAFRLLWVLSDDEPRTLRELAGALDVDQSTVNRQVHAAMDAGFLERFERPGCVGKLVRPTASGRAAFEHDGGIRVRSIQAALDVLGPERSATMIADLREFNDAWDVALARAEPSE